MKGEGKEPGLVGFWCLGHLKEVTVEVVQGERETGLHLGELASWC